MRYLWPGLPQLLQGRWEGLGWALIGAVVLNGAFLTTVVWPEWVPTWVKGLFWGGCLLLWGAGVLGNIHRNTETASPESSISPPGSDALFVEAIEFYLQGQWFEAEKRFIQLLRQNPRDVEARLMIATLFRHTRRWQEAGRQLDQLERLEASRAWALEIHRERQLLQQAQAQLPPESLSSTPSEPASNPSEEGELSPSQAA